MKVKRDETREEIVSYLKELRTKQEEYCDTEDVCYSKIGLYLALKKKILFKNFLLHPVVLEIIPFHSSRAPIEENELESLLAEVLEFELTSEVEYLTKKERDRIIRLHKSLKKTSNGTKDTL
jgi:hypothetical protein